MLFNGVYATNHLKIRVIFFPLYNDTELFICTWMEFCQKGLCQVVLFSNVKTRVLVSAGTEKWKSGSCKNVSNDSISVCDFFQGANWCISLWKCDSKWDKIFLAQMFKPVLKCITLWDHHALLYKILCAIINWEIGARNFSKLFMNLSYLD